MNPFAHVNELVEKSLAESNRAIAGTSRQQTLLGDLAMKHAETIREANWHKLSEAFKTSTALATTLFGPGVAFAAADYLRDAAQRTVLFVDALRERGNSYIAREAEGFKPVLIFPYETVIDGRTLERPVNYELVRILPPEGYPAQREEGRPFMIIDPRAGHGSGIGGYKSDSEVGVALRDGHPVYFVIFRPDPEPGQTLADVCAAEAEFLKEIIRRHPSSPKPLVLGNCQGGWASMLLAATNPDLPGPIVIAGAPLSYWAGTAGRNPMRYLGGLVGGAYPALLLADLANGRFDGANLVLNFEHLNPANTWWRKYYDVFAKVDTEAERYLEFERWWSGFYFMNEAEIRWIIENLFIGNRLTHGTAVLDDGQSLDLRRIRSPIVVFASHGDNITPPEQALFWIADLYKDTREIVARGQVIIYTLHDSVGHLGIFVSSSVARKQHKQITSTVKTIEALAPGLYEMVITEGADRPHVAFEPRQISDILALSDDRADEIEFAAVARLSEWATETYELTTRPFVKAMMTPTLGRDLTRLHPMRQRRYFFSDQNPLFAGWGALAEETRRARTPVADDNPFLQLEKLQAQLVEDAWNFYRDTRDAMVELAFHAIYDQPFIKAFGREPRVPPGVHDIRLLPEVRDAVARAHEGGFAEAVIRMFILMAHARGAVRRSRLERSNRVLQQTPPFADMQPTERSRMIHEQTLIVDFAPEVATTTLSGLFPNEADRQRAIDLVFEVAGPLEEMSPPTIAMFQQLQFLLGVTARDWREPDSEVRPFTPSQDEPKVAPAAWPSPGFGTSAA
jgi:pimeloyl-ACP methyl ester carboxylesterase/tellurite resistance protein